MRRVLGVGVMAVALGSLAAAAHAGRSEYFSPENRVISRASLAGVTPRSSWTAIRRAWGGEPTAGTAPEAAWGRSVATWRSPGLFSPLAARVAWAGPVGSRPIRFAIDLEMAAGLGFALRTPAGDRLGTPVRTFLRRWPRAERLRSGAEHTFYFVDSSYRGWRLAFLFRSGRLKEAQLVRNDFVNACYVRNCPRGFPPR